MRTLVPLDPAEADALFADLLDHAAPDDRAVLEAHREALRPILDLSPYLFDIACKRSETLATALRDGFEAAFDAALEGVAVGSNEAETMRVLRHAKQRIALVCGVADLLKVWPTMDVTRRLALFADRAVEVSLAQARAPLAARGRLSEGESGFSVIAMGKYGAGELNYSSDIDIIVFFDADDPAFPERAEALDTAVRVTRSLVRIMQERTADGYVFRTDLRLRPDPSSMPLAMPVTMALIYYETRGQNWERAAWIKARACAGDATLGATVMKALVPFVWRRHLDYAAIADIHSIKRQIQSHHDITDLTVPGHNVKLGRGGIREIEFFVQTQQLIAGGRTPSLRGRETLPMLDTLAEEGWIERETAAELAESYLFLRDLEHRIQMVRDAQAHSLPEDEEGLEHIARMAGFADAGALETETLHHLVRTERHYASLFEHEKPLSSEAGNLAFTGGEDDPQTLETLAGLGFERPADMAAILRGWHFGRARAMQSTEARERLTALMPDLLAAIARTGRPDAALVSFDAFLAGLPRGIQLFSLLEAEPRLLDQLLMVLAAAPRMAAIVQRRPHVFDALIEPGAEGLSDRETLERELDATLGLAVDFEGLLDRARVFAAEQRFVVGVRLLSGAVTPEGAGRSYATLAEVVLTAMLRAVTQRFEARHGRVEGRIAVLAMGRLGSRELSAASDLDLVFLVDHEPTAMSDGEKPLPASQYHIRVVQQLIAAMNAPTSEGVLYPLDFRLRPSGNAGPLATTLRAFREHQTGKAQTWEHLALTRMRAVAGDAALGREAEGVIDAVLATSRERKQVAADVWEMRTLMDAERPPRGPFDVKLMPGGLIDLEFMAQFALLAGLVPAQMHARPIPDVLAELVEGSTLAGAYRTFTTVSQLVALGLDGPLVAEDAPRGLVERLLAETGEPGLDALELRLVQIGDVVRTRLKALLDV